MLLFAKWCPEDKGVHNIEVLLKRGITVHGVDYREMSTRWEFTLPMCSIYRSGNNERLYCLRCPLYRSGHKGKDKGKSAGLYCSVNCEMLPQIIGPIHSLFPLNSLGSIQPGCPLVHRTDQLTILSVPSLYHFFFFFGMKWQWKWTCPRHPLWQILPGCEHKTFITNSGT